MVTALLCALFFTALPSSVHAYSNFSDYVLAIEEGGGGGRLFTGTPADGYGCDVCHQGAEGAELQVIGLPTDGYVPGQTYEIALQWPQSATNVALMAEVTDLAGGPAGTTGLLPVTAWQLGERCTDDATGEPVGPGADICRVGGPVEGCCLKMGETAPENCSFPNERSVLWVEDCRSDFARMVWTAPTVPVDVWFSTEMVTSDLQFDAAGDGTTSLRMRLHPVGGSTDVSAAVGDCRVTPGLPGRSSMPTALGSLAFIAAMLRRARRARRTEIDDRGHRERR